MNMLAGKWFDTREAACMPRINLLLRPPEAELVAAVGVEGVITASLVAV